MKYLCFYHEEQLGYHWKGLGARLLKNAVPSESAVLTSQDWLSHCGNWETRDPQRKLQRDSITLRALVRSLVPSSVQRFINAKYRAGTKWGQRVVGRVWEWIVQNMFRAHPSVFVGRLPLLIWFLNLSVLFFLIFKWVSPYQLSRLNHPFCCYAFLKCVYPLSFFLFLLYYALLCYMGCIKALWIVTFSVLAGCKVSVNIRFQFLPQVVIQTEVKLFTGGCCP